MRKSWWDCLRWELHTTPNPLNKIPFQRRSSKSENNRTTQEEYWKREKITITEIVKWSIFERSVSILGSKIVWTPSLRTNSINRHSRWTLRYYISTSVLSKPNIWISNFIYIDRKNFHHLICWSTFSISFNESIQINGKAVITVAINTLNLFLRILWINYLVALRATKIIYSHSLYPSMNGRFLQ